ncbi:MAG: rod shape-determining protein MreC [Planctomycetes bacterium]|nr:rod shape-determining protein MreC [Planctomycetota bacterium]
MRTRRGRFAAWPLAALSMALMALPAAWTQSARLTLCVPLRPFRSTALAVERWLSSLAQRAGGDSSLESLRLKLDYAESKNLQYAADLSKLKATLASVTGARQAVKDPSLTLLPASVILPVDGSPWRRSLLIARGTKDGVARGMPVLWHNHLLGIVADTGPWSSRVTLITDPDLRIGARAVPLSSSGAASTPPREPGILEGSGESVLWLKWISGEVSVAEGTAVVTTPDPARGIPEGLLLGRVKGSSRARGALPRIQVVPLANARAVDSVLVLLRNEP